MVGVGSGQVRSIRLTPGMFSVISKGAKFGFNTAQGEHARAC